MEKIIKLQYPLEYEDNGEKKLISEIKLRRLKGRDFKLLPASLKDRDESKKLEPHEIFPILSIMSGIPEFALEELDLMIDLVAIMKEIASFL